MTDIFKCPKCKGDGYIRKVSFSKLGGIKENRYDEIVTCSKCNGTRYLDWIENIVGKKPITFDFEEIEIADSKGEVNNGKK